jgi:prevent-host-death family protein
MSQIGTGNRWNLQDAKARLSELVDRALTGKPQLIRRRGVDAVIVVRVEDFTATTKPGVSLLEFLASRPHPDVSLEVERSREVSRDLEL